MSKISASALLNQRISMSYSMAAAQSENGDSPSASGGAKCVFSVDVEDWFHINGAPSEPDCAEWDQYPSHVSRNFRALLEMLAARRVRATCFFLGWVAEKFPELVREARDQGHEIASHGYAHRLVHRQTPSEFLDDIHAPLVLRLKDKGLADMPVSELMKYDQLAVGLIGRNVPATDAVNVAANLASSKEQIGRAHV